MSEFAPEQLPIPGIEESTPPQRMIVVSKEDRLESENLHLRALSTLRELQLIQMQVQQKTQEHHQLQAEILQKRKYLEQKYGIDMNHCQIRGNDGVVVQRTQQDGGIAAAMTAAGMEQR